MTTWEEIEKITTINSQISVSFYPSVRKPNTPYISAYKDGLVYVGNARCSLRLFKKCPYDLMKQIIEQFIKEQS